MDTHQMPMFYFNIQVGENLVTDQVSLDLPDIAAALREATVSAASIARDELVSVGGPLTVVVVVRDERGQTVLKSTVSGHTERLEQDPLSP
jgi:hypothetical protein